MKIDPPVPGMKQLANPTPMAFITDNFLLEGETARYLYRKYAASQPILDFHCHLSPRALAENRRFQNLFEIWLEGDHYKWRAMRANGVPEFYCTGGADPYEKFLAWAGTVPATLRNPLYHWTHLELLRHFGITELLDQNTAPEVWKRANFLLSTEDLTPRGILSRFCVQAVCTSDDPADSLEYHEQLQSSDFRTHVFPTFRPDQALRVDDPAVYNAWVDRLGQSSGFRVSTLPDLLDALERRHEDFHRLGCRLSDHGLDRCPAEECSEAEAAAVFQAVRAGNRPDPMQAAKFSSYLMLFFGRLDAMRRWTKQLHLGAYRNANRKMLAKLGRDTGFDSIGDWPQVEALGAYLDRLEHAGGAPKMVIYNANPADNYAFASMAGNFQDGPQVGKVQFGSSWWFLDQKEGIEWQLNALSNCGLLNGFVGMVTDSRSFMSYPRHEYFRRVLCNLLGAEMERGELPDDEELVGGMISTICYDNATRYLGLPSRQHVVKPQAAAAKMHFRDGQPDGDS
jgi:glucuronate isomerase